MSIVELESGLRYEITKEGTGPTVSNGQNPQIHYQGYLNENYADPEVDVRGTLFDSSVGRNSEFTFPLGGGFVIAGCDQGIVGMKIGEKRTLYIPSELAYGSNGAGGVIPPNADLIFDVELMGIG